MNPSPAPDVPGTNDGERFHNAVRTILSVSKTDILKAEEKDKQERKRKKRSKR